VEPPKISHKKKTDRERERERLEKELADQFADDYRQTQQERGRPLIPREPLKRTADNKWVHVTCSLWTPEIKYSNAKQLEVAEGIPLIPRARRELVCKICKTTDGACVACLHCHANFHIACAFQHGYTFGFDVSPVKGSRRDGVNIVTLGEKINKPETGTLTAAIWCREHSLSSIKTIPHMLNELVDNSGLIALQLYAENYKQADLTLTGTARKANFLDELTKSNASAPPVTPGNRRVSAANATASTRAGRNSSAGLPQQVETREIDTRQSTPQDDRPPQHCAICDIDTSPRWYKLKDSPSLVPRSSPIKTDGHLSNGIKPEILPSTGSPMQMENGIPPNGYGAQVASRAAESDPMDIDTNGHTEAGAVEYVCHRCNRRRKEAPEEPKQPVTEPERLPTPPIPQPTPPRHRPTMPPQAVHQPWNGMHLPPQQHWQPYTNGTIPSPQGVVPLPHHHAYHAASPISQQQPPPGPPPGFPMGGPQSLQNRSPYMPPSAPQQLHSIVGLSNGHPSPHAPHVSMRSPPHPQMTGMPRQVDGPFTGPPGHALQSYNHHHGSPVPSMPGQRPSTPRDVHPLPTTPRIAHGASASPNVRNILND
jgi:hypothetical protein